MKTATRKSVTQALSRLDSILGQLKNCGAGGGPGRPGFQPGNSCARGSGSAAGWQKTSPTEFIELRNRSNRPGFLSPLVPDDIKDHQLFTAHGGTVGYALSPEGDIQNVFNNGGPKGAGVDALADAIDKGGRTLDCYDGFLPGLYGQMGFQETGRMKFNREYAPEGWDYEKYKEPDVVFMAWKGYPNGSKQGEAVKTAKDKTKWNNIEKSGKYYDGSEWDQAKADSRGTASP